ncbi:hypothetical protein ACFYPX_08940 [Micromonospora zamorensis]|uniref:hypothetical protein n=1 Tax=Micromonospora zamorensis TaxID=709883 RepID=UPI0036C80EFE
MGEYNPDRPYVLGMQWAPLVKHPLHLDTASEVGYVFRATTEQDVFAGLRRVRLLMTAPPPGRALRKTLTANLYRADGMVGTGPLRKLVISVASGELVTGAALAGGASQPADAVSNPSDPRYVTLTGPNAAARFWFGTLASSVQAALLWRRVVDVSVLYVMSGPFADLAPAVTLGLERPSAGVNWVMDDTLGGPADHSGVTAVRRSRLGELNPWWSTAATPLSTRDRMPYSYAGNATPTSGLTAWAASGGTNINMRLQVSSSAPAGTQFQVHYLALEVTYGEETRVGGGGLDIGDGAAMVGASYFEIPIVSLYNFGYDVSLSAGYQYAVTVGQAHVGQLSVASPVPVPIDRLGTVDRLPGLHGVLLRKTLREGAVPTVETVNELPAIVMFSGTPAPGNADTSSHAYLKQAVATLYARYGWGATLQRIPNDTAGTFVWVRLYARHLPGTRDPLVVAQLDPADEETRLGPRASITVDEFDALPEVADGWKEVTLRLDPPLVATGSGGQMLWAVHSSADNETPWQVLGADAEPISEAVTQASRTGYGGQNGHATIDATDDRSADLTLMLLQEMDTVTGVAVQSAVQPLVGVDEHCARPVGGVPTGIHYHRLTWEAINSEVVVGWGAYEVQRQDDTMYPDEWETIARIAAPNVTAVDDYEARVGVESRYRVRMVHRIGAAGPWSAPVAATIPAPGVTGTRVDVGVLILTSNHDPAGNLAYVMNPDRSREDFTFPEAGQVELQAMFDRDYRTAFRPLERGGVEFTRTLLVNAAAVSAAALDKGFRELRDLAWDSLPYVCVRDELDNRWLATLLVPSGTVRRTRRRGQMQLAQVTVVEVADTPAPVDGGPPPCEGLRAEGSTAWVSAQANDPAGIDWNPLVIDDQFAREVQGGFGSTDTPGDPWVLARGPADGLWVTGGAGVFELTKPLNANPYFETNVANWTVFDGAFTWSTAQVHQGVASGRLVPNGVAAPQIRCELVPVTEGRDYQGSTWVRCAATRAIDIAIHWLDAAQVQLSQSAVGTSVTANTWTRLQVSGTAPVGAKFAFFRITNPGTPPVTAWLDVDEAILAPAPAGFRVVTGPPLRDVDVQVRVRLNERPITQPVSVYLPVRYDAMENRYEARLAFMPDGSLGLALQKLAQGVSSILVPLTTALDWQDDTVPFVAGDWYWVRIQCRGQVVSAAAWKDEPGSYWPGWTVQALDGSVPGAGAVGLGAAAGGITNANPRIQFDSFQVREPMANVDIRVLLRTSGEVWNVWVEHLSDTNPESISSGWDVDWSDAETCFEVFGKDLFYQCVLSDQFGVVRNQRRWLRAVYEQDIGGGLARVTLYSSLDGVTWGPGLSLTDYPEPLDLDGGFFGVNVSGDVAVSRVEIRNGVDGPIIVEPDFEAQPKGTKLFIDAQGASWEVDGVGICGAA